MNRLFITGASGFVGVHLWKRLASCEKWSACGLSRTLGSIASSVLPHPRLELICGDLLEPSRYEQGLASADCVIHLAATTGKARPAEYSRTNVEGTRVLVEQCRRLGVHRFLYVSSIAVKFPDRSHYFYAQSKEQAEEMVRRCGVRYTIVRPTIILGRAAPAWNAFARLARLPVVPVFGDGRAKIQPIHVEDLVDFLLAIVEQDRFDQEILELGGPEATSIEDFMRKAQALLRGGTFRAVHLPLGIVIPVLTLLEKFIAPSVLPVTVGQLSSFRYDSTIQTNRLFQERVARLKTVDEMLALCNHDAR